MIAMTPSAPAPFDLEAVGPHSAVEQLTDGSGRAALAQTVGHARDASSVRRNRSSGPGSMPPAAAAPGVGGVGKDLGRPLDEQVGRGEQGGVLRPSTPTRVSGSRDGLGDRAPRPSSVVGPLDIGRR
jgi:hypothetical protein